MRQELLPDEIKNKLPKLYAQDGEKDPIVYVKYFTPWAGWTWLATEGQEEGDDFMFFGYVIGHEKEWGYFCLSELLSVKGPAGLYIERDEYFPPKHVSQIPEITTHEHTGKNEDLYSFD